MSKFRKTLFIFRRDLRLEDNTGLIFALKNSVEVIPAFIFTREQIKNNPYLSNRCLQFMIESLEDVEQRLAAKKGKLFLFFDHPEKIVEQCIKKIEVDCVVVNRDYTPYSIDRDKKTELVCKKNNIPFFSCEDALLHAPETCLKADGTSYTIFTPFYRNASKLEVRPPDINRFKNYHCQSISFAENNSIYKKVLKKRVSQAKGGRREAIKILKNLKGFSKYKTNRNSPYMDATTHLSPHLKFTTCSPREVYYAIISQLGSQSEIIRSLYWRDFFTSIGFYFPHVFQGPFREKYKKIKWNNDKKAFLMWCEGKTGFPIVDAGMREMNETGYMHNRVRMIVASFLVKDLHINWQWGEKYFAQALIDYDPAVNNGNWQWVAGTGCDATPYFRIFNPWTQAKKFDPKCLYIKKWVPELAPFDPKTIHEWYKKASLENTSYPPPMLDHSKESKKAIASYKKL